MALKLYQDFMCYVVPNISKYTFCKKCPKKNQKIKKIEQCQND